MFFTIKEMAEQLGVTPNKLRYYEKMGLISPSINEKTGYRYYSVRDTRRFNAMRLYRSLGLSISDCKELLSGKAHGDLMDALDAQQHALQNEISYQIDKLQAFLFWKPFLESVYHDVGKARTVRFPTMYRVIISENEKRIKDAERERFFQKWLQYFPVVSWASRIKKAALLTPDKPVLYDYGLLIQEDMLNKYELHDERFVERIEGGLYVYTVFKKNTDYPFDLKMMALLNAYMQENGLFLSGDGFSNCIYSNIEDDTVTNYHYFMVKCSKQEQ